MTMRRGTTSEPGEDRKARPTIDPHRVVRALIVYTSLVVTSELTFGRQSFPVHFWYFTTTPAWAWSVPVHGLGFLWVAWVTRQASALRATLLALSYFVLAETLNFTVLRLFTYEASPLGEVGSLIAILGLYTVLCTLVVALLRAPNTNESS